MITQPITETQQTNKIKNINPEKQKRIQKCQQITKQIESKLTDQIQNGQLKLRSKPLHIQLNDQPQFTKQNPQKSIRDKISTLNSDLEMLQKHIAIQKQQQRVKQQYKKRQASMLIQRLKRQKQEYRNKMKLNQMSFRLKNSVLSEDVLKLMRERRDSLVQEKKKDMELRIYKNLNRKVQRQDDQAKNQINYWSKVKQMQVQKRHHSTKVLPSIHKVNEQPQFGVNLDTNQRKNSLKNLSYAHKRSFSKQDISVGYLDVVNRFLERAKAKQYQSKSEKNEDVNIKSRVATNQANSQKNQFSIINSRLGIGMNQNQKIQQIHAIHYGNKHKLLGNQYLKQSLLKVSRAKSPRLETLDDNNSFLEQSLQLKGSPAVFSKNDKITDLQDRRQKIFQNLLAFKIDKTRAIQMLGPIQSKLDKINPQGIELRLRNKLQIFQQYQQKTKQLSNFSNLPNNNLLNQQSL